MRKKIIAGNWKMNKTTLEARALVDDLKPLVSGIVDIEIVVCPPFTALSTVRDIVKGANIALGAQNMFWKSSGAYTSQISAPMLTDLGVTYVIIGHSEPRGRFGVAEEGAPPDFYRYFGENDYTVNLKTKACIAAALSPIVCVGETLDERNNGRTDDVVTSQVQRAMLSISPVEVSSGLVFAYEPVWAIGTGKVCDTLEANRMCGLIRGVVSKLYSEAIAAQVRIQYGGSMKPDNAAELLAQEHIDGGLIGGASLKASDFAAIVKAGL